MTEEGTVTPPGTAGLRGAEPALREPLGAGALVADVPVGNHRSADQDLVVRGQGKLRVDEWTGREFDV